MCQAKFTVQGCIGWMLFWFLIGSLAVAIGKARGDEPPLIVPVPVDVRYQVPPVYPHQVPYRLDPAPYPGWEPDIGSNQDIKDGIQRPNDRLYYGCWLYFNHNYYAKRSKK